MKTIKVNDWSDVPKYFTGIIEDPNETKYWYKDGNLHREDGPAIECVDGTKQWYKEGKWHREDGPAVEYSDGEKWWYKEGKFHREDGPAVEHPSGHKEWHKDGKRHREDGPAYEYSDGSKHWFFEDQDYEQINLNDFVVLDSYKGKCNLVWYKILGKDEIIDYPDIPGLIVKE